MVMIQRCNKSRNAIGSLSFDLDSLLPRSDMSAYGAIATPQRQVRLVPRTYPLAKEGEALTIFPVRKDTVPQSLVEYLAQVFNDTVEDGRTYPQQEKLTLDEFVSFEHFRIFHSFARPRLVRSQWPFDSTPTSLVRYRFIGQRDGWRDFADCVDLERTAADCFVAIRDTPPASLTGDGMDREADLSVDAILAGRELKDAVLGMYCASRLKLPPNDEFCG